MIFGQVWSLKVPEGEITVMVVAEDPDLPAEAAVHSAVILSGYTLFNGNGSYLNGSYGPGDIGPVKFGDGDLLNDASP